MLSKAHWTLELVQKLFADEDIYLQAVLLISDLRISWFYSVRCRGSTPEKAMAEFFLVLSD
jgi:hypothetical protein